MNPSYLTSHLTLLRSLPLFQGSLNACLEHLLPVAEIISLLPDRSLFHFGDPAKHYFIVLEGQITLFREQEDGQKIINRLCHVGDCFGEAALLERGCYAYHAETSHPTLLWSVAGYQLRKLKKTYPHLALSLFETTLHPKNLQPPFSISS